MKYFLLGMLLMVFVSCTSTGTASWYGNGFEGKLTASGYVYDSNQLTCASNKYPFGTVLRVTNKTNGKSVLVVVTDRGGFDKYGREVDLSKAAFKKIATLNEGLIDTKIEVVSKRDVFKYKHGSPRFNSAEYKKYIKGIK